MEKGIGRGYAGGRRFGELVEGRGILRDEDIFDPNLVAEVARKRYE
jgi:hypothetical protein